MARQASQRPATQPSPAPDHQTAGREVRDHLGLLAEMTREFTANADYKTVASSTLERITKYMGAEAASLFLLSDSGEALVCSACYGPVDITGLNISANTGVVGGAVAAREGALVRDVSERQDFGAAVDAKTGFTTRSLLVAPLVLGNDCLGAIEVINRIGGDGRFNAEDLLLLETLAGAAALAISNFRLTHKIVQQERNQHELELAAEIQRDLLPQPSSRDFPIHGINIPARSVSGDFFDIMPMPDGRIWFNVADVSGKGMNAALLMAKTSSLFRCLAKSAEDPGQLLNAINNELCETNSHGMFVTMVGGLFHPGTGILHLTNAGHEPPLHFDLRTERFIAIPADAPPLGIAQDIAGPDGFPVTELFLAGGMLYVFTDGLTEATTFGGGMLGIDGVRALIRDHAEGNPGPAPQEHRRRG
jgi:sigma-B regulation protein RsbU (phosphoserine phosphatase)